MFVSIFQFVHVQQQSEPNQKVSLRRELTKYPGTQISGKKDLQDELVPLQKTLELVETPCTRTCQTGQIKVFKFAGTMSTEGAGTVQDTAANM